MPRGWLLVLCLLLTLVEPMSLALVISGRTAELTAYPIAAMVAGARILVTGLGIAAGIALWTARPAGPVIAKSYLIASSILIVALVATPYGLINRRPGTAGPLVSMIVVQNALWFAYLVRSRQVRDRSST